MGLAGFLWFFLYVFTILRKKYQHRLHLSTGVGPLEVASPHWPVEPRGPASASLSPAASATSSPILLASMDHRGRRLFFHPTRSRDLRPWLFSRGSHEAPGPLPHVLGLGSQLVGSLADRGMGVKKTTFLPSKSRRNGRQFLKYMWMHSLLASTRSPSTW